MIYVRYPIRNTDEALIYQGRVTAVYPATMTVDIYVPEINNEYRGVYILSDSIQTTYGAIAIPEVDSVGLIVLYHRSKQPVVMGFIPPYKFNSGEQKFEYLKPGECQTSSKGGGYFKGDVAGNGIVGNAEFTADIHLADGSRFDTFLRKTEISNFHKNDLHIDYNSDIITIDKSFEYCEGINLKTVSTSDIYKDNALNKDVIEDVLNRARKAIRKLSDDEGIFTVTRNIMLRISDHTIEKSDIDEYVEKLSDYTVSSSGTVVRGEMFKDNVLSIHAEKGGEMVAGIEIDENGGKLVGRWNISD